MQHHLTVCIINENSQRHPYEGRLVLARTCRPSGVKAIVWLSIVGRYWRDYRRDYPGEVLSTSEHLLIASELAAYYDDHIKELCKDPRRGERRYAWRTDTRRPSFAPSGLRF